MAEKSQSPFTGIRLTSQTSVAPSGADQKLFSATPKPPVSRPQPRPPASAAPPAFQGSLEPRKHGPATESRPSAPEPAPSFDINQPAYQNNTYAFTEEELWAIEDTKQELERRHGIKVTKYNLIRLGVHMLIEDFRRNDATSFAVKRLRKHSP